MSVVDAYKASLDSSAPPASLIDPDDVQEAIPTAPCTALRNWRTSFWDEGQISPRGAASRQGMLAMVRTCGADGLPEMSGRTVSTTDQIKKISLQSIMTPLPVVQLG